MTLHEVQSVASEGVNGTRQTKTEVGLLEPSEGQCRQRQGSTAQSGKAYRLKGIRGHVGSNNLSDGARSALRRPLPQPLGNATGSAVRSGRP